MRVSTCWFTLLFVVMVSATALASPTEGGTGYTAEVDPKEPGFQFNGLPGEYRFDFHRVSGFTIDEDGTQGGIEKWGEHRLRLSPELSFRPFYVRVELDVLGGQILGDHENFYPEGFRLDRRNENSGLGFDGFLLREAYVQYASPWVALRIGQMASEYGLGLLANAGREDDNRFGVRRYGDIVDRAMVLFTPFQGIWGPEHSLAPLTFMASGDMVYRDENADFMAGDNAYMANAGLMYRHDKYENNIIFTYRDQEDEDGDTLEVYALNLNGRNRFVLDTMLGEEGKQVPNLSFKLEYEAAWLFGKTDRLQQLGAEDGLNINAFAAVGRLGFEMAKVGLEAEVEVGYASGDKDAHDDESHSFSFDPDYNVGMIFFDEMLPLITARSAEISADPSHLQVPPKGLDLIASQGRVTNTLYYFPQIRYTLAPGVVWMEKFKAMFGALLLSTASPLAHSYYTFRNGGVATNYFGRETDSSFLGTELLLSIQGDFWVWPEHVGLSVRAQGGAFLPGDALADLDGNTPDSVYKGLLTLALFWK